MKNIINPNSRITHLRESLKLSQTDFAENIGITQSALSQLEAGKSKLSMDSLKKINEIYHVNCNWLVNGQGEIFLDQIASEDQKSDFASSIQTIDISGKSLIPLVKEDAHAGYINGINDIDYLKTLDVYKIPGYEKGNYRLFEIAGDSMTPSLLPGEIVVSSFISDWSKIENGLLCVVITQEGIVAKRVYFYEEDRNLLILKSDNPEFKTYTVNMNDVMELWEIKAKITSVFSAEQLTQARKIENMESDIDSLKKQMHELSKNLNKSS